jgi:Uma2 family endonuclease
MGVLKPLPLQGRGLERGQSIHSKLFKHPLIYTYPGVIIIADEPEFFNNRTDTITNPQVIIEVLSKSTKSYDREDRFAA